MKTSNIIPFPVPYAESVAEVRFDYAAYERRAAARFRRASLCAWIVTAVEAVVTAAIGACVILGTLVFLAL